MKYECESLGRTASGATEENFNDPKCSGGMGNKLNADGVNDYIQYDVYIPSPGTWNISIQIKKQNSRGKFRLFLPQTNAYVGSEYDQYAASDTYTTINLGSYNFQSAGVKQFRFIVTGKNSNSKGYTLGNDAIIISR